MQTKRASSRNRYQTVLPSCIEVASPRSPDARPAKVRSTTQLPQSDTQPHVEKDNWTSPRSNFHSNGEDDFLPNGVNNKRAAYLADSQLPYQRLLQERDYARNMAAQLNLSDEADVSVRGQNSSETDRSKTESSKSSNPDQHTASFSNFGDNLKQSTKPSLVCASPGGSTDAWNHMELLERLHPQLGAQRTPYRIRSAKKTYVVIEEPEPEDSQPQNNPKTTSGTVPNIIESPEVFEQQNLSTVLPKASDQTVPVPSKYVKPNHDIAVHCPPQPSTYPPRASAPEQGRPQLEELRRLIPPPLPVRHTGRSVISEKSYSPVHRSPTPEAPEYECVEGVTLDTQPVAAKEKASGLPLPVIEAQDIRNIPPQDSEDDYTHSDDELDSAVPSFNFVKRSSNTDRHDSLSILKRKIQQSSVYQAILPTSNH